MGFVKAMLDEDRMYVDVPSEAFTDNEHYEVNDDWLLNASENDQIAAILNWFYARYCDPAHETPCMSSEGGYIWIHGGPYDAREEIEERFNGLVPDEVLEYAVEHTASTGTYDWAPTSLKYYDDSYDVSVYAEDEPITGLEAQLDKMKDVLSLSGSANTKEIARNLVYAGVISALETFLWQTMTFWINNREETVKQLITNHPHFRDRSVRLGDIYSLKNKLVDEIKVHMQNIVWHNPQQVAPMFKYGVGINLGFKNFDDEMQTRHNIVHRSGHDFDGNRIAITEEKVRQLMSKVWKFAESTNEKINSILMSEEATEF